MGGVAVEAGALLFDSTLPLESTLGKFGSRGKEVELGGLRKSLNKPRICINVVAPPAFGCLLRPRTAQRVALPARLAESVQDD